MAKEQVVQDEKGEYRHGKGTGVRTAEGRGLNPRKI